VTKGERRGAPHLKPFFDINQKFNTMAKLKLWMALAATSLCVISATQAAQTSQLASQIASPAPTPFPVCIDDSDCVKLGKGDKFACFQYICYPWKNDSIIEPKNRRKTCRIDNDCEQGQECFRHHDKRMVNRGLCFDEVKDCQNANECSKGYQCCGGTCCEEKYYHEFAKLPCISDLGCQDLGLGQYCCPQNGSGNYCCDTNPNPPTTPYPQAIAAGQSVAIDKLVASLLLMALLKF